MDDTGRIIAQTTAPDGAMIDVGKLTSTTTIYNGSIQSLLVSGNLIGNLQGRSVEVFNGDIVAMNVGGIMSGPVYVENGRIQSLSIGTLESPDYSIENALSQPDPAQYYRGPVSARFGIDRLTAGSINKTNIIANLNGTGNIGFVKTTQLFSNSSLVGNSLTTTGASDSGVLVQGSTTPTNSKMSFRGNATEPIILSGGLAAGTTVNISGSLAGSNALVTLPADGLKGQIIINSKDGLPANAADGVWTAPVLVGGQSLTNLPYYNVKSSDLGGGAVGLVPFGLYRTDSTKALLNESIPLTRGVYLDSGFRTTNVADRPAIAFYGPVKVVNTPANATELQPFTVKISNEENTISMDVSHLFRVVTDPTSARVLRLEYRNAMSSYLLTGRYTITNNASGERVVCDINQPNVPVDMLGGYQIDIGRDCNDNNKLDSLEIAEDVTFTLDVAPTDGIIDTCPHNDAICVADINGDLLVDDLDFTQFAIAYNEVTSPFGDFDGDFDTDDADFVIFAAFYNRLDCTDPWPM
jgi:hypothetical protein